MGKRLNASGGGCPMGCEKEFGNLSFLFSSGRARGTIIELARILRNNVWSRNKN